MFKDFIIEYKLEISQGALLYREVKEGKCFSFVTENTRIKLVFH